MKLEKFDWKILQPSPVIGVDEVGRGCLAGPVYAAAVVLKSEIGTDLFTDSKALSPEKRETLSALICEHHLYGIGIATVDEIAKLNILQASLLAMRRAVEKLGLSNGHVLVDGNQKIPQLKNFLQTTLIKGDLRASPVAAASIVAKVARDKYMDEMHAKFPQFGFEKHKGYGTPDHKKAIQSFGPCEQHRTTFAGVKEFVIR